jgi:DNA-directed RNA polymerase subunit RPC12/RpoP
MSYEILYFMGIGKGVKKEYYCYICKKEIKGIKEFKKHIYGHYDKIRCPLCLMPAGDLKKHLTLFHIRPRQSRLLYRDLAILVKEAGTTKILKELNIKLERHEKEMIWYFSKKL